MAQEYVGYQAPKVDNTYWGFYDWVLLPNGRRQLVTGPEEVVQACERRLRLWRGAWMFDTTHGFPYWKYLGAPDEPETLKAMELEAAEVIMLDPRIRTLDRLNLIADSKNRIYIIEFEVTLVDGTVLEREFTFAKP